MIERPVPHVMQFVRGYELYDYVSQYHPNT